MKKIIIMVEKEIKLIFRSSRYTWPILLNIVFGKGHRNNKYYNKKRRRQIISIGKRHTSRILPIF